MIWRVEITVVGDASLVIVVCDDCSNSAPEGDIHVTLMISVPLIVHVKTTFPPSKDVTLSGADCTTRGTIMLQHKIIQSYLRTYTIITLPYTFKNETVSTICR